MSSTLNKVLFLFLRRMRLPLLVLTAAYSISVIGLVLIPGIDDQGEPWRMDFFHAFYFVSYMATTIGFGEIPYAFSEAQRMWTVFAVYLSVVAWLYAIGKLLALLQDPAFKLAVSQHGFDRSIRRLRQPFYIVCGYGDTGALVVRSLLKRGKFAVVIDRSEERITELALEGLPTSVPALCGDASVSSRLMDAGLRNYCCQGVVALTDSDEANLKIAITAKLLNPELPVYCRAERQDTEKNLASFGTDQVINPFTIFAQRLGLALRSPAHHMLHQWLNSLPGSRLPMPVEPPHGRWILCGFGRFGKAIHGELEQQNLNTTIIESNPGSTDCPEDCIEGRGTEADTLLTAGIHSASAIVAGTNLDTHNLSILMTARELNPGLFFVGRQNREDNALLFDAADLGLVMRHDEIIAEAILAHLTSPLLPLFLQRSCEQEAGWVKEVISRITAVVGERVPAVWSLNLDEDTAPALLARLNDETVTLGQLLKADHPSHDRRPCIALLLQRAEKLDVLMAPGDETPLKHGDRILFCGQYSSAAPMALSLKESHALEFVLTGQDRPEGWIWRLLGARPPARL
ncbi:potassium channel family protein [Thioalkalivibrio sulfidiphilus]|uniref:potassium channel family protein n=1 Tax=Thioalkalivibrio sulfidiphilus TaxID=1033854 RepID=UPI003B2B715F